jgi:hypothetical protein
VTEINNHPVFAALSPEAKALVAKQAAAADKRVVAIRKHPKVGVGSCSVIDECYTNVELVEKLNDEGITTVKAAVKYARIVHDNVHGAYAENLAGTYF